MKILITGSSGFIGSSLISHIKEVHPETSIEPFDLKEGKDIFNSTQLREAVGGKDIVIHLAGFTNIDEAWNQPKEIFRLNAEGSLNVLLAAKDLGVKLIHVSSCEVYGDNLYRGVPITESHPICPLQPYSVSKAAADFNAQNYMRRGADIVILRPFNTYGQGSPNKIIPQIVRKALAKEMITIYGSGEQRRDYLYIQDTVAGIWEARNVPRGVYNLSTGKARSLNELIVLASSLFSDIKVEHIPQPSFRPEDPCEWLGDSTKFSSLTGWKAKYSILDGMKEIAHGI